MTITTPRQMIETNAPEAIGITSVVISVQVTKHSNKYLPAQPYGLLKIVEVGLDGQVTQAVFSRDGVKSWVCLNKLGASMRGVEWRYADVSTWSRS
jgi:hypothetical protein